MTLFLFVLLAALVFEYINGFHDTANAIATVVSTKVLSPRQAVAWAAFWNLIGARAVLTETIFARLGIGRMYVEAILNKDFTLVQGATLFIAVAYVFINIAIDVAYAYVDPRISYD